MPKDWTEIDRSHGYFRVALELVPSEEGGRSLSVLWGYRPQWDAGATYEGKPMMTDAQVVLEGAEELRPGGTATARLHPAFPEYWSHVQVGQTIDAYEGSRRVARATVTEVSPPER